MMTDKEKQEIVTEITTEAVPQIVKLIREELAKEKEPGPDQAGDKQKADYAELVRNAMK